MSDDKNDTMQANAYAYLMLINYLEEERSKKALEKYYQGLCDGYTSYQIH